MHRTAALLTLCLLLGCGGSGGGSSPPPPPPPPPPPAGYQLGSGNHTPASVTFTVIATAVDQLMTPRDLAFNPRVPDDLWIVSQGDDSVCIVHNASLATRTTERRRDVDASHFMESPAALAFGGDWTSFGTPGTWATAAESNNGGNNFTGPTIWSSDLAIFAMVDPFGLGSHLDMLHCSPYAMGIAWQANNVYWIFGGSMSDIVRYDFQIDHGVGMDDHSDGLKRHYLTGLVSRVVGVPGHLYFHNASNMLYIADTGNGRVIKLDTTSGTVGAAHAGPDPVAEDVIMNGAVSTVVVAAGTFLTRPCGLEIMGDVLFVSDNSTGIIHAFDLAGNRVNYIDTGLGAGAVMGLAFGPDGKLYFANATGNQIIRINP